MTEDYAETEFNKYYMLITTTDNKKHRLKGCGDSSYIIDSIIGKLICRGYVTQQLKYLKVVYDMDDIKEVKIMKEIELLAHYKYI